MALNEKPSTPVTAHTGPIQYAAGAWPGRAGAACSSVPADDATPGRVEDEHAERDAIPRERHEVVMAHIAQQPSHAEERRHERRREADTEGTEILRRQQC